MRGLSAFEAGLTREEGEGGQLENPVGQTLSMLRRRHSLTRFQRFNRFLRRKYPEILMAAAGVCFIVAFFILMAMVVH